MGGYRELLMQTPCHREVVEYQHAVRYVWCFSASSPLENKHHVKNHTKHDDRDHGRDGFDNDDTPVSHCRFNCSSKNFAAA